MMSRFLGYAFAGACVVASCFLFYLGLVSRPGHSPAIAVPRPVVPEPGPPPARPAELPEECAQVPPDMLKTAPTAPAELIKYCRAADEIIHKPRRKVDEARCGPEAVVNQLRTLDQCAQLNELCDLSQAGRVDVKLIDILGVSKQFPTFIAYFGYSQSTLQNRSTLVAFVKQEIAADPRRAFMIFGSASPTSRDPGADEQVAKDRTEAAFQVVDSTLERIHGAVFVQTRKASVGRGLDANFCDALERLPAQRAACERLDDNARRQAAFVISYPRACLEADE